MAVTIRAERAGDHAAIHAVHAACFPTLGEARLVDALRASGRLVVSLVALAGNHVVGHVAFSPVTLHPGADDHGAVPPTEGLDDVAPAGLAPVAVLPAFRRRGVAERLIREGLALCARDARSFVVVLGEPDYYGRFGFRPARTWALQDEYGGGDAFQALELRVGAIPARGGVIRYAPEFAIVAAGD